MPRAATAPSGKNPSSASSNGPDSRVAAALSALSACEAKVSDCELRVRSREEEVRQDLSSIEARLAAELRATLLKQRENVRTAVRGLLSALSEEQLRRESEQATVERRVAEAEAAFREESLLTHRKLDVALSALTTSASQRAARIEAEALDAVSALAPADASILADAASSARVRLEKSAAAHEEAVRAMRDRQEEGDAACATACDSLSAAAAEMSSKLEQLNLRVEEATGGVTDSVAQIAASLEQQRAHAEAECARTLVCIREGHASEASEAGKTLLATITAELDAAALLMGKGRAQDFYSQRALGEVAMGEVSMQKHGMMERDAAERALLEKWLDSAKSAEASIDEARALSQSMGDLQSELAGVQAQAAAAESRTSGLLSRLEEEVTTLRFQTEALASTELDARSEARHAPSEPELDIEASCPSTCRDLVPAAQISRLFLRQARLEEALTARARAEADLAAERAARYALEVMPRRIPAHTLAQLSLPLTQPR